MSRVRRPAREIAEELKRLVNSPDPNRGRASLLHEVQVFQEELTVQNEELRQAQADLEETRDRFVELYDFAPTGYLTLDDHGVILQINLVAAGMFGKERHAIHGMPLMGYVAADQRTRLLDLLRRCRRSRPGSDLTEEFRLESRRREVRLFCRPRATGFIFTSLVDLTEVKRAEAERRQATAARAALAGRLISIQEDERHRIARDMHDNIGQQMTALRLKLDTMAMDPAAGESLRAHIVRAQEAAEQLDRALDFIAAELRPASLEHGFVPVLEEFVRDWSATFGIRAEFHTNGLEGVQLSPAVAMHMYRVMQEALNNIFKHARAGHAQVIVERRDEGLILIVEDDGAGFSPEGRSESSGRGLGLVSMRERAALIGGSIEIESTPGKGSTVFFQVPNPGGGSGDGQA